MKNTATIKPHLFTSEGVINLEIEPNTSIETIIQKSMIPNEIKDAIVVYVDDTYIDPKDYEITKTKQDQIINISVLPRGGGDSGKGIMRLVAMIVVTIASIYTGGLAGAVYFGGSAVATSALTMAFSAIGMLAVNALIPMPSVDTGSFNNTETASITRTITGASNQVSPYSKVAKIYGIHKYYPKFAGQPYIYNANEDSYMIGLYDFGYSEVELNDIRLGTTPISDFIVDTNFLSNSLGDDFKYYTRIVDIENVGLELLHNTPIQRSTPLATNSAEVEINFPSGLTKINDQGDLTKRSVNFVVKYRKEGSNDPYSYEGLNIHGSAVDYDLYYNVSSIKVRLPLEYLYTDISLKVSVYGISGSYQITADITGALYTGDIINISNSFTAGQNYIVQQNVSAGSNKTIKLDKPFTFTKHVNENSSKNFIYNNFYVLPLTGATNFTISANKRSAFTIFSRLNFPSADQYEIVVERITEDSTDTQVIDVSAFSLLRSFKDDQPCNFRTYHSMYELKIKANEQINGVVQNLNAICTSKLNVYDGADFNIEFTNNPAWIVLDILMGSASKYPMVLDKIDINSFKVFADYCDELVSNQISGEAYISKRHTINIVVDYTVTVYELIGSILSSCRSQLIITTTGKFGIMTDQAKDLTLQLFTPRNSTGFEATRTYADIPHALKVKFVDPDQDWVLNTVIVYNDGYDVNNAVDFEEVETFGIINYAEAWRYGRYMLAQMIAYQESFTLNIDLEFLTVKKGDKVAVQHDVPRIGGIPLRVKEILNDGLTIIVNDHVNFNLDDDFKYTVRSANLNIQSGDIVGSNAPNELTLGVANPDIHIGDLLVYGVVDHVTNDFLIKSIEPEEDLKAKLTLVPYNEDVYSADVGSLPSYDQPIAPEIIGNCRIGVHDLSIINKIEYINRYPHVTLTINWEVLGGAFASYYELEVRNDQLSGNDFVLVGKYYKTQANYLTLVNLVDQTELIDRVYSFRITAVDVFGNRCKASDIVETVILGDSTRPPDIDHLNINILSEQLNLTWNMPDALDISHYVIRYTPETSLGKVSWESSTLLTTDISHNTLRHSTVARTGTYMIKAVDTSGNVTLNPAYAVTTIPNLEDLNVIEVISPSPDWIGHKHNMEINGTELQLSDNMPKVLCDYPDWILCNGIWDDTKYWNDNARWLDSPNLDYSCSYKTSGYYDIGYILNLGEIYTSRLSSKITASARACNDFIANWDLLSNVSVLSISSSDTWNVDIEVQTATELSGFGSWDLLSNVVLISDTIGTDWSTPNNIAIGDFTGRYYKFRLNAKSSSSRLIVKINNVDIEVDMPDRIYSDNDIIVNDQGMQYRYDIPFHATPSIAISIDNAELGSYYNITNKNRFGFDILFKDGSDLPIDAQFDLLAKGYGRQLS